MRARAWTRTTVRPDPQLGETMESARDIEIGRRVLVALYGEPALGIREIASSLGTSRGTVYGDERKALRKLGAQLREEYADG